MNLRIFFKIAISLPALLSSPLSFAQTLNGDVVAVADGDTLTILDADLTQYRIRLAGIDAPEKSQPFGQVSKQKLSKLCYDKPAQIKVVTLDKYNRVVGDVTCDQVHANAEMVRSGLAWVYRQYAKNFEYLFPLEKAARESRVGLWIDPRPTPPWEWRRNNLTVFH
ncbi:MAG: thermonuclease family protein [Methylophilaceae bacterium]